MGVSSYEEVKVIFRYICNMVARLPTVAVKQAPPSERSRGVKAEVDHKTTSESNGKWENIRCCVNSLTNETLLGQLKMQCPLLYAVDKLAKTISSFLLENASLWQRYFPNLR